MYIFITIVNNNVCINQSGIHKFSISVSNINVNKLHIYISQNSTSDFTKIASKTQHEKSPMIRNCITVFAQRAFVKKQKIQKLVLSPSENIFHCFCDNASRFMWNIIWGSDSLRTKMLIVSGNQGSRILYSNRCLV